MDFQVLATRGNGGYRQYRIPALAVTPSGKILAIYDGRSDLDDLPGPVDLVFRVSDDNGSTWSQQKVFLESQGIKGFGDPSIIIDPTVGDKGRILVFCQASNTASFFESSLGSSLDDPTVVHIHLSISDDDGQSWRHKFVTEQLKDSKTQGIFASSGMGGRIPAGKFAGRLIHSMVLRRDSELMGALAYSDDHGENWSLGAIIPGGNESGVACLNDGSILVHSRATPFRLSARSLDGGQTLSDCAPDPSLPDPSDNGSLCVLSDGSVICTHNHDHNLRRRVVAKRSIDGGKSWPEAIVLEPESSAYSTACELADGKIGVLFERYGYTEMVFARFAKSDLRPTPSALVVEQDENQIEFNVVFRYVRPGRDQQAEERLANTVQSHIPKIDMNAFSVTERKEIGPNNGSASGDPIYTKLEFEELLGPVRPGLHLGDEIRFSGRIKNLNQYSLKNVSIETSCAEGTLFFEEIEPGKHQLFMDVRQLVTEADIARGVFIATFAWNGELDLQEGRRSISGSRSHQISTKTGLPVDQSN